MNADTNPWNIGMMECWNTGQEIDFKIGFDGKMPASIKRSSAIGWIFPDKNFIRAERAVFGFRILGPKAQSAIPSLRDLLDHAPAAEVASRETLALAELGSEGLAVLKNAV